VKSQPPPRSESQSPEIKGRPPVPPPELRWPHWINIFLGAWLVASPFALGYRSPGLIWSDWISGLLLLLLGGLSLSRRAGSLARWSICLVGLWLLFAPLVFWAPTAAAYTNNTLVGALAILFAVIVPGAPGNAVQPGPDIPPGWSYNPSTWLQRSPIIALALVSFLLSRYLAAYQLHHIEAAWDPFFGQGTRKVLDSEVSRAWPVSDAGLGAVSYLVEALSGGIGNQRRWRTMPWVVALFGVLVVPLGIISIVLVILQPLAVGAWCTLCLVTAVLMLVMIAPSLDEIVATGQYLWQCRREGQPFWRTFWRGGAGGVPDESARTARAPSHDSHAGRIVAAIGVGSVPWNLLLSAALGIWLMAAPALLGSHGGAAASDHLVGPLVVTFAVIAWGEISRPVRYLNILLALWIIGAPWLLGGATAGAQWNALLVGVALIGLSLPRGSVREQYGNWNRFIV
jgi:hypothetical protein